MRTVSLFVAASVGLLLLSGAGLWFPDTFASGTTEAAERRDCRKLLNHYDEIGTIPARGDPDRSRYVDCYYLICGVMLDGEMHGAPGGT